MGLIGAENAANPREFYVLFRDGAILFFPDRPPHRGAMQQNAVGLGRIPGRQRGGFGSDSPWAGLLSYRFGHLPGNELWLSRAWIATFHHAKPYRSGARITVPKWGDCCIN